MMNVITNYKAVLKLRRIEILESKFHKSESSINDDLNLSVKKEINKKENGYDVFLEVTLSSADDSINVYVKAKAIFETEDQNEKIIERNGIAIMFPYIRSYVSLITTQPGMSPIILPAINIVALLASQEKGDDRI